MDEHTYDTSYNLTQELGKLGRSIRDLEEKVDALEQNFVDIDDNKTLVLSGRDGKTNYTWLVYSHDPENGEVTNSPQPDSKYIGIATNKNDEEESNNPKDYNWVRLGI